MMTPIKSKPLVAARVMGGFGPSPVGMQGGYMERCPGRRFEALGMDEKTAILAQMQADWNRHGAALTAWAASGEDDPDDIPPWARTYGFEEGQVAWAEEQFGAPGRR
jgi:hypothetical protein